MAPHRHKRETNARLKLRVKPRAVLVAAPLALAATATMVSFGVLHAEPSSVPLTASSAVLADDPADPADPGSAQATSGTPVARATATSRRSVSLSRKAVRGTVIEAAPTVLEQTMAPHAVAEAVAGADTRLWSTTTLNLWTGPSEEATNVGEIDPATHVLVTGRSLEGREEVVLDGAARWVTTGYLDETKPEPAVATGAEAQLGGTCTNGSVVSSGVDPHVAAVHEAVCAAFPDITVYGTFRGDGEHAQGIAIDIMVSGSEGYAVRDFVQAHATELGVSYIIYSQAIWSVQRSSEGFRAMEDRGSTTANHYDHVHVTTYFS